MSVITVTSQKPPHHVPKHQPFANPTVPNTYTQTTTHEHATGSADSHGDNDVQEQVLQSYVLPSSPLLCKDTSHLFPRKERAVSRTSEPRPANSQTQLTEYLLTQETKSSSQETLACSTWQCQGQQHLVRTPAAPPPPAAHRVHQVSTQPSTSQGTT